MKNTLLLLILCCVLSSCLMPPCPMNDYYRLSKGVNEESEEFYTSTGYIYKNDKYVLSLWVFSTPWKSVYLSTNLPVEDSVKVLKNNGNVFYLKRLDEESFYNLPYNLYHNDSIQVYGKELKIKDKNWYYKQGKYYYDTLKVEINNKKYAFYYQR